MTKPNKSPARMIEVAPGRFVRPGRFVQLDLKIEPPETVFCDLVPIEGQPGAYRLEPRSWERLERVTKELCQKLGLGPGTVTIRRLIRSGFVDGAAVSPEVYAVNLVSFFNHMKRCAEDPDFWQNPKVLHRYRETYY